MYKITCQEQNTWDLKNYKNLNYKSLLKQEHLVTAPKDTVSI